MKKPISLLSLTIILLQSCVAYQKIPSSLNEANDSGKVEVNFSSGKTAHFANIILKDSVFYGINFAPKYMEEPLDSTNISALYLESKKDSRINSWVGVSVVVVIIGLIIWGLNTPGTF